MRDYSVKDILGVDVQETPETLAYEISSNFTAQVIRELDERGMSFKELADRMEIKQPTLCGMLKDDSNLTLKTMARMALALDCELETPRLVKRSPSTKKMVSVVRGGKNRVVVPSTAGSQALEM